MGLKYKVGGAKKIRWSADAPAKIRCNTHAKLLSYKTFGPRSPNRQARVVAKVLLVTFCTLTMHGAHLACAFKNAPNFFANGTLVATTIFQTIFFL
jgi:hypothetical protein